MDLKPLKKKSSNLNLTLGETHVTEKHKLEPVINNNWSVESLKKTCDLNEFEPEPEIQPCDYGQQIAYFDSCQLTVIWMSQSVIKLNTDISHWFLYGADGRVYSHVITKISCIDRLPMKFS